MRRSVKRIISAALAGMLAVGTAFMAPVTGITDYAKNTGANEVEAAVPYNYAKLLQESLYFYDANMCGGDVSTASLQKSWRSNCHTYDWYQYRRSDGVTVKVDLTGGYHDAGDHVKFGLPAAYSAFVLGMSYDTNKDAYESAGQTGHLRNITTRFADYFVKCAVLNANGTSVDGFCVQVGQGGGGYDHGYWGNPSNQPQSNRTAYFSSSSDPSTDIVSLSAAALAMQYKNFGGQKYLDTAKKLFDYAKRMSKGTNKSAGSFYASSGWEDDYCLAAIMLYKVTGDKQYLNEFNNYYKDGKAKNYYWPLGWDNVAPAVAYYNGNSQAFKTMQNSIGGSTLDGKYKCVNEWGSARYNTSLQYTALMYDKLTGTKTYRSWAEGQMNYLLGQNPKNQCYVVGFASNSSKYPHHRAASGYTGGPKGTTKQAHVLLGALVGGPSNGGYRDTADDYQCNEVAIDYNATLVAAAAAIYSGHKGEAVVDPGMYTDGPVTVYEGVDYSAVYDYQYYINHNPDVKNAFGNDPYKVLQHFVNYGMKECRQAKATFDVKSYKNANVDLREAFGTDLVSYYKHYINYGKNEGRKTTGVTNPVGGVKKLNGVDYSAVYDFTYYSSNNPDVKRAFGNDDIKTLQHFVNYGMKEGRQGIATFNPRGYAYRYGDLRHAFKNSIEKYYLHFIKYGKKEGRSGAACTTASGYETTLDGVNYSKVYDYNYYINKYPDIKKAFDLDDQAVLKHFVTYGMKEGRQGKASFDVCSYKNSYPDLRAAFEGDIEKYYIHYINYGSKEGRNKTTGVTKPVGYVTRIGGVDYKDVYDFNYYLQNNPDIRRVFGNDDVAVLKHFVNYGMKEGRVASKSFNVNYYKNTYGDLRRAFGNNMSDYYMHYIKYGKKEGRKGAR